MRHLPWTDDLAATVAAAARARAAAGRGAGGGRRPSSPTCARAATTPCARTRAARRCRAAGGRTPCRPPEMAARARRARAGTPPRARDRRRQHPRLPRARGGRALARDAAPGPGRRPGGRAAGRRRALRARRPRRLPVVGAHDGHPRPGGRCRAHRRLLAAARRRRRRPPAWPPPARSSASTDLFPIGGAQAVAAMAFGTASVPRCDVIVGPGNAYVTEAKRQVMGEVRHRQPGRAQRGARSSPTQTASRTGWPPTCWPRPSTARARWRASLDVGGTLADRVAAAVERARRRARHRHRQRRRRRLPRPRGGARPRATRFAPEHLELHLRGCARAACRWYATPAPSSSAPYAATAFADYAAGTNHVLPTGGSARFGQGLSVDAFQKRVGCGRTRPRRRRALAPQVAAIADEEGLRAHARSARLRAE